MSYMPPFNMFDKFLQNISLLRNIRKIYRNDSRLTLPVDESAPKFVKKY